MTPAGTSLLVTAAPSADAALAKVFAACGTDTGCSTTFPQLPATFERLLAAASTAPITVAAVDPVTGLRSNATFDYVLLSETVRFAVYSRAMTEILPFAIDAAAGGNWAPLLGIGAIRAGASGSLGMQLSVLCAEDWPIARDVGPAARSDGFMRDGFYEIFERACTTWPRATLPAEMLEPFASSVPALAISGEFDPVTPPELAEQALRQFSTAVHVVVPNGFHGNSENPCVARIIASFLSDPATGGRDHECASATPPLRFFTGPSS